MRCIGAIVGMMLAMAASPVAAQSDFKDMPAAAQVAARAAAGPRMEAMVREAHRACAAAVDPGDSQAFEYNGILLFGFEEARRRGMDGLARWTVERIAASTYPVTEAATPHALLGKVGDVIASSEYPRALPLYRAYVEDALKAGADGAALDDLVQRAEQEDRWGRPASEIIFADGAAAMARRVEGDASPRARTLAAQSLRAQALLGRASAAATCAQGVAGGGDAVALHMQVSCGIALEQAGHWREAEAMLRTLLPAAQAQPSPIVRADVLLALGRNLNRQQLWAEAIPFLTAARDLLEPLASEEDDRVIAMPAVRAARAAAALNIAEGNLNGKTIGGKDRLLGRFFRVELNIAAADAWARAAEELQRDIDTGRLQWEGGVWRQMLYAYQQAADEMMRLYGQQAPMVGVLRLKHVQGREQFLTSGYRDLSNSDHIDADLTRDLYAALRLILPVPLSDRYRIEGSAVAAAFLARKKRDVPQARTLCRTGMTGALEQMRSAREFDNAAQAQLRAQRPLFNECVKIAWLAKPG